MKICFVLKARHGIESVEWTFSAQLKPWLEFTRITECRRRTKVWDESNLKSLTIDFLVFLIWCPSLCYFASSALWLLHYIHLQHISLERYIKIKSNSSNLSKHGVYVGHDALFVAFKKKTDQNDQWLEQGTLLFPLYWSKIKSFILSDIFSWRLVKFKRLGTNKYFFCNLKFWSYISTLLSEIKSFPLPLWRRDCLT